VEPFVLEPPRAEEPAGTPPVETAEAGVAAMAKIVRLIETVPRVRTRKATTSFVGLRG
jgi:hypothetical protein